MGVTCNLPASDLGPCKQRAAAQDPGRDYLPSFEGMVEICKHACCATFGLFCMQNVGCQIAVRWLCAHAFAAPSRRATHMQLSYTIAELRKTIRNRAKFSAARSDIGFLRRTG
jgi:hypothetical protein